MDHLNIAHADYAPATRGSPKPSLRRLTVLSPKVMSEPVDFDTVRLKRSGRDPVDILSSQISSASLARIFSVRTLVTTVSYVGIQVSVILQLDPNSVWLREEFGSHIYFPDISTGCFTLPPGVEYLMVEGSSVIQGASSVSDTVNVATPHTAGNTRVNRPAFGSLQRKSHLSFNIKIVQATLKWLSNGKPEFNHLGQLFVDITEATANVHYILSVVQKKWGRDYNIVTADGLQLDDCSGTQGSYIIWNVNIQFRLCVNLQDSSSGRQEIARFMLCHSSKGKERQRNQCIHRMTMMMTLSLNVSISVMARRPYLRRLMELKIIWPLFSSFQEI